MLDEITKKVKVPENHNDQQPKKNTTTTIATSTSNT